MSVGRACSRSHTPVPAGNERSDTDVVRRVAVRPCAGDGRSMVASMSTRILSWLRGRRRYHARVRHDRVLRLATEARRLQRCQLAPRRDGQRDVAGRDRPADPGRHQRGPRPDVGRPGDGRRVPALPRRRPRRPRSADRAAPLLGANVAPAMMPSCGPLTSASEAELAIFAGAACATSSPGTARTPAVLREPRPRSRPRHPNIAPRDDSRPTSAPPCFVHRHGSPGQAALGRDRPIQVVFRGERLNLDRPGQRVIQEIFSRSRSPELRGRVFHCRGLRHAWPASWSMGSDVWLNNPRRRSRPAGRRG